MISLLKREIEKRFDRIRNYEVIIEMTNQRPHYHKWIYALATAGVVSIMFGIIFMNLHNDKKILNISKTEEINKNWIIKEVDYEPRKKFEYPMSGYNKKWDDRTLVEKYSVIEYSYLEYNPGIGNNVIEKEKIGEKLEKTKAKGFNSEEMKWFEIDVSLYSIDKVSEKVSIAVKFENDENYYAYANLKYVAEDFHELIEDFNLRDNLSFDYISYDEWYGDREYDFNYIEFLDVDEKIVWNMLLDYLDNPNIKSEYCRSDEHKAVIGIHLNLEKLGFKQEKKDYFIGISEDGYVRCGFIEREKYFYIGEETARSIYKVFN